MAIWIERTVVYFQQYPVLFGCQHQRLKKQIGRTVSGVTDNVDMTITYSTFHSRRILLDRSRPITQRMKSGYANIQKLKIFLFQVERTFIIDYIYLGA